jgi:DNA-binding response OmpR family regulator
MPVKVLLADDDADFLDVTAYALRRAGYAVSVAPTGDAALESWRTVSPDIAVLDVAMPTLTGIEVCREIRRSSATPVVLMGGGRRESEVIEGFEAGADDYVTKPFSVHQLVLRLRAVHRRTAGSNGDVKPHHLLMGPLEMDLDSFTVELAGKPVRLTRLEFLLFYSLAANAGRVVTTQRLIDFAWGLEADSDGAILKTHFSHIRRKLNEVSSWPIGIRAVPGIGYSLHIGQPEASPPRRRVNHRSTPSAEHISR